MIGIGGLPLALRSLGPQSLYHKREYKEKRKMLVQRASFKTTQYWVVTHITPTYKNSYDK